MTKTEVKRQPPECAACSKVTAYTQREVHEGIEMFLCVPSSLAACVARIHGGIGWPAFMLKVREETKEHELAR